MPRGNMELPKATTVTTACKDCPAGRYSNSRAADSIDIVKCVIRADITKIQVKQKQEAVCFMTPDFIMTSLVAMKHVNKNVKLGFIVTMAFLSHVDQVDMSSEAVVEKRKFEDFACENARV